MKVIDTNNPSAEHSILWSDKDIEWPRYDQVDSSSLKKASSFSNALKL